MLFLKMNKKDCVFCKMASHGEKREFVAESDNFFAVRDIKPKAEGHTLVIPKRHFVTFLDLPHEFGDELMGLIKKVANDLMDDGLGTGFNIAMNNFPSGGQVVMHAHLHIVPRNEGDGLHVLT